MNRKELAEAMATKAGVSSKVANDLIGAFIDTVSEELGKGGSVQLVGFGTFATKDRPEREGRNPQTGESMTIKAARLPSFKAGAALKAATDK